MSLEYGGLFDFENNWATPHRSHRIGINADIGFSGIDNSGSCVERLNLRDLEKRSKIKLNFDHLWKAIIFTFM